MAHIILLQGFPDQAGIPGAETFEPAREYKPPLWQAYATAQQIWYLSQTGQFDAAIAMLYEGLARSNALGVSCDTPMERG